MFNEYFIWLRKVNALLLNGYNIETNQVWQADWRFDWYQTWVAGCKPYEAVEDAIMELSGRGILEEIQESTSAASISFGMGEEVYIRNPDGIDDGMLGTIDEIDGDRYRVKIEGELGGSWWREGELQSAAARAYLYGAL